MFSDPFITGARKKLFKGLDDAGKYPNALKERIEMLSHHVCDEHEWDGGIVISTVCVSVAVGNVLMEISIAMARNRLKLTCQYHTLAYRIELNNRAGRESYR